MKKGTPLQYKIVCGYIVSAMAIGGMAATLLHERNRVVGIESEMKHIHRVQHDVNTAHRYITLLAMRGETALAWEEEDFEDYRSLRLRVDTMLQTMQDSNEEFVSRAQIDTLRHLLANKEEHLHQIMLLFREQDNPDGLLLTRLPEEAKAQIVTRKKKGVAGFFGAKETVQVTPSASATLHALNKELQSMQEERQDAIDTYADSLCRHNKVLNRKLRTLINTMNNQTERVLEAKSRHLQDSYDRSTRIITGLIISAIVLLVISYLIIQRDLREKARTRKRLEETIEQNAALLEMRKNIILTISHDIRAPLNIISGNAELAMDTRERKRRNIYLDNIGIVCRHVVHLLNNLLDVYRLNEAKEIRNDVPFNLHELLERTASGFSHVVNNKGIRFDCDFRDTEVRLYGDADRIEQIIDNLLTNAVKFTESGTISFNVSYHSGELAMEVKDTGIGMSEETLSRIFRPFERRASAANADGYGLGLSITQGLVNLLGGSIHVTSSVDRGSTFRVTLPLPETDEPAESENRILPHSEHLPHNVLVIDDDSMLRDVVKDMLERNGVACTACSSAKEVVMAMRCKDYDLLLSDIQMPGTNGFELLALLRSSNIGNSRTIPVVAMTARGDREKKAYLDAGFTACIYKPFSSSELLSLLSTIKRCRKDENRKVDFSTMLAEVNDKVKLLCSFVEQSRQDAEELASAMNNADRKKLRETVHRMQPMWELLQMADALSAYRALLKDDTTGDDVVREHTHQIIECTAMLIAEAENEIKKLTDETENTDS
jgi:two-component system aerobic respiration control sensor histidine kinase ArcB